MFEQEFDTRPNNEHDVYRLYTYRGINILSRFVGNVGT